MSSRSAEDAALSEVLDWALRRMEEAGYPIQSKVSLVVDPNLSIMGYAKKEGDTQYIIAAGWALDSEMFGGLVLHELSHIYHAERGAASHDHQMMEEVLSEMAERDGLNEREEKCLLDSIGHLQNIIVDDIVFEALTKKELVLTQSFFSGWVSQSSTGDPVVDASLLARNAFAVASLKRRNMYDPGSEIDVRSKAMVAELGAHAERTFNELESLLEKARPNMTMEQFRELLASYLEKTLSLMREREDLADLR